MPTRTRLLEKRLTYRDRTGGSVADHVAHWDGFQWQAGPVIVSAMGPFGEIQAWAASEAEGRRVVAHALAGGGWANDPALGIEWAVATASGGRNGRTGTMEVMQTRRGPAISKRDGPSGPPNLDYQGPNL